MQIWRLVAHHISPVEAAETYKEEGFVAIGWGHTGDLKAQGIQTPNEAKQAILKAWPEAHNAGQGGRVLCAFVHEMQAGDLVIISNGKKRTHVMEITGDYYWVPDEDPMLRDFMHRRPALLSEKDPNALWRESGGAAPTWSPRWTLLLCGNRDTTPKPSPPAPKAPPPTAANSRESIKQQMRDLKELFEEGILTEGEYKAEKKELLAELRQAPAQPLPSL